MAPEIDDAADAADLWRAISLDYYDLITIIQSSNLTTNDSVCQINTRPNLIVNSKQKCLMRRLIAAQIRMTLSVCQIK